MAEAVEARLSAKDDGLSDTLQNVIAVLKTLDATVRKVGEILLKATDQASKPIQKAEQAAKKLDECTPEVVMEAQDKVTEVADKAADAAKSVPEEVQTVMESVDHVTERAHEATAAAESVPESEMTAFEAVNHTTAAANQAADSCHSIPTQVSVSLEASDGISGVCDEVCDKLEEVDRRAQQASGGVREAFTFGAGSAIAQKGLGLLSSGLKSLTTDAVGVGQNFEASMSNVRALSKDASGDSAEAAANFQKLSNAAKQAGESTQFSASEAADALGFMALAAWDTETSVESLPAVLHLAAASGMELAEASDTVTDYVSAFSGTWSKAEQELGKSISTGERAAEMVDLMAYAQANSNTSAAQLGDAWKNCAASFNAAGQDVQTTTSFLEALANQGLKGSEAGTAMAAVMRDITAKMENGAIKIGNTSIAVQEADGSFRDLSDIMKDVEVATDGMGDAQKAAALASTFTADSQKAVNMALNEGMDSILGYEAELRNCQGTASETAKTMNDNLAGDLKSLNSAWEAVQVTIFEAVQPALRSITQIATEVCRWVNQLISGWDAWQASLQGNATEEQKKKLEGMTGVMESIYRVIDFVRNAWNSFVEGFKASGALDAAKDAVSAISDAFGSLTSSLGDGSGAKSFGETIGEIAKFIAQAIEKIVQFEQKTGGLLSKLTIGAVGLKTFGGMFGKLGGMASAGLGKVTGILRGFKLKNPFSKLPTEAGKSMGQTRSKVAQIIESIGSLVNNIGQGISTAFTGIGNAIATVMERANPLNFLAFGAAILMVGAAMALVATQSEGISVILQALGEAIGTIVESIGTALGSLIEAITPIVEIIAQAIVQIVETLAPHIPAITEMITEIARVFGEVAIAVTEAIAQVLMAIAPFIPDIMNVATVVGQCVQTICTVFQDLIAVVPPILEQLDSIIGTIFSGIQETLEAFGEACKDVGEGIKLAFEGVGDVIRAFGDVIRSVLDGVAGIIDSIGTACLNAGTGFKRLAEGIEIIGQLDGWGLLGSLSAAAGGVAAITAAAAGIGDSGNQFMAIGNGLIMIAQAGSAAALVGSQLGPLTEGLQALGSTAPTMLMTSAAMKTMSESAVQAFGGLIGSTATLTLINGQLQTFGSSIQNIISSFSVFTAGGQMMTAAMSGMQSAFGQIAESAFDLDIDLRLLKDTLAPLGAAFMVSMVQMQTAANEIMPAVASAMSAGGDACIDAATQTGSRCAAAFAKGMATVQAVTAGEMSQVAAVFAAACQTMQTMTAVSMTAIVKAIQTSLRPVPSFVKGIVSQITAALRYGASAARSAGSSTGSGYTSALGSALSGAPGKASAAVRAVMNQLQAGSGMAYTCGQWIGDGLISGMDSRLGRVQQKASQLAKAATDAIRQAAEIGSPSKITTQYGKWIGEGLANGMDRMQSTVQRSADSLMNLASPGALSASLETRGISPRTSGDVLIDIHQEIDGREWARATHRFTRAEFEKADRIELHLTGG